MSAAAAWQMGVPFNAVNQVYQLGFPELPWGNDAYLPTNIQKVGHWVQPRSSSSSSSSSKFYDLNQPVRKMLELVERNSK